MNYGVIRATDTRKRSVEEPTGRLSPPREVRAPTRQHGVSSPAGAPVGGRLDVVQRFRRVAALRIERWQALLGSKATASVVLRGLDSTCSGRLAGLDERIATFEATRGSTRVAAVEALAKAIASRDRSDALLRQARSSAAAVATPEVLHEFDALSREYQVCRNALVMDNLGLARQLIRRMGLARGSDEDLLQDASLGLIRAIERFDPDRGVQFSTYAMFWLRDAVLSGLDRGRDLVRVPGHLRALRRRIAVMHRTLAATLGREAHGDEVVAGLGIAPAEYMRLHQPEAIRFSDPDDAALAEDATDALHEGLDREALLPRWDEAFGALGATEQHIIRGRFGLDREPATLEQLGVERGLSRERIRQIERTAVGKLRAGLRLAPPSRGGHR